MHLRRALAAAVTLLPSLSWAAQITLSGAATGTGYLVGCQVAFWKVGGLQGTAVTDKAGVYSMVITSDAQLTPSDLTGGLLKLTTGSACKDAGTGLHPAVSLGALVPEYPAGTTLPTAVINGFTTLAYYTKKNVNSAQIKPYQAFFGGPDFEAGHFYSIFGGALGLESAQKGGTEDVLKGALAGDANDMKGQALSVMVLNSLTLGSALLQGLKPGISNDTAAEAMIIACYPAGANVIKQGLAFDLYRQSNLIAIFLKSLGGAPQDIVSTGAETLSEMNTYCKKIGDAGPSAAGLAQIAQVQSFGQTVILPLIPQVTSGSLTVSAFAEKYQGAPLSSQYNTQQVANFGAAAAAPAATSG